MNRILKYEKNLINEFNSLFEFDLDKASDVEHDFFYRNKLDQKLFKIVSKYLSKSKKDMKNYLINYQRIKLSSYFPFYFNDLPNTFLAKIRIKKALKKAIYININENLTLLSKGIGSEKELNLSFRPCFSSPVLPCNISDCMYDYDSSSLKIKMEGRQSFSIPNGSFHFYVNSYNNINSTQAIYNLLEEQKRADILIIYDNGETKKIKAELIWGDTFNSLPINLNLKLRLNFPEIYTYAIVNFMGYNELDLTNIKEILLNLEAPLELKNFNLKKAFHLNLFPCINLYQDHSEPIKYDAFKESYPVINREDNFVNLFDIIEVYIEHEDLKHIVEKTVYKIKNYSPESSNNLCYELEDFCSEFGQNYPQIKLYLPTKYIGSQLIIKAYWMQKYLYESSLAIVNFKDRQKNIFDISLFKNFDYKKYSTDDMELLISKAHKVLSVRERYILTVNDIIFLTELLCNTTDIYCSIQDLIIDVRSEVNKDTQLIDIIFHKKDIYTSAICKWFFGVLIEFIKNNTSILDSHIKIKMSFNDI